MKQSRIIGIILVALNIVLIAVCAILYFRTDRTAPKFHFEAAEVVYREGMDQGKLLEGITAMDEADGDVTDHIVIEKVLTDEEENTAVVFFAVSDRAGNVAKASKVFPAVLNGDGGAEAMLQQLTEAGIDADLQQDDRENGNAGESETDGNGKAGSNSDEASISPDGSASPSPEPTASPSPTATPTPTRTPVPATPEPAAEPAQPAAEPEVTAQPAEETTSGSAAPTLTLKMTQVKTRAGSAPAWVDVIGTLTDDKDNYETLFHNLSVSKYDKDTPGTYQVTVSTEDSDGNKSAASQLTIIVQ